MLLLVCPCYPECSTNKKNCEGWLEFLTPSCQECSKNKKMLERYPESPAFGGTSYDSGSNPKGLTLTKKTCLFLFFHHDTICRHGYIGTCLMAATEYETKKKFI